MGKLEGKGRRAGFLKAFECVIYIPIHTIYASIYLSPFLLNKTQDFPFYLLTLSFSWSNGTQTLPFSRHMTKEFVLNSRGQKHLLESAKEGYSVGLERGKWGIFSLFLFMWVTYYAIFLNSCKTLILHSEFTPECIAWRNKENIKQQVYLYYLSERFLRENEQLLFQP